jgi:cysteine desulfuration protein SufE
VTVAERQDQLINGLEVIPDRQERLSYIVERARRENTLPLEKRIPGNRVPGCVSPVWMVGEFQGGRLKLSSHAEAPVVNGLVRLLCEVYDGALAADAAATEPEVLERLDLLRDISPTRRNGLAAVRERIRALARAELQRMAGEPT